VIEWIVLHTITDLIIGEWKRSALHTPSGVNGAGTTSNGRVGGRIPFALCSPEFRRSQRNHTASAAITTDVRVD